MSAWPITCLPFIGDSTSCAGPAAPASKNSCTGALDWLVSSPPHALPSMKGSLSTFWKTASIGVSVFPEHGRSYELLRRNADSAMYRARSIAKGGAAFFDDCGNNVPEVQCSGPSAGTKPSRGTGCDSMPIRQTG